MVVHKWLSLFWDDGGPKLCEKLLQASRNLGFCDIYSFILNKNWQYVTICSKGMGSNPQSDQVEKIKFNFEGISVINLEVLDAFILFITKKILWD